MQSPATGKSPYDTCTVRAATECEGCRLHDHLKCRFSRGDLLHFVATFFGIAIPAGIGMVLGGYGWFILGWVAFMLFFFNVWEIRILCSHCPYYADAGRTLHCIANYGSLKLWRYHPEPMSKAEKAQLIAGFIVLGGYPLPFLVLGQQWVLTVLTLWGGVLFFWTLIKTTCARCVNFSCPFNRVPGPVVAAYLERNPVMKRAWEASGRATAGDRQEDLTV